MKKEQVKQILLFLFFSILWFLPPESVDIKYLSVPGVLVSAAFLFCVKNRALSLALTGLFLAATSFLDIIFLFTAVPPFVFAACVLYILRENPKKPVKKDMYLRAMLFGGTGLATAGLIFVIASQWGKPPGDLNTSALIKLIALMVFFVFTVYCTWFSVKAEKRRPMQKKQLQTVCLFALTCCPSLLAFGIYRHGQTLLCGYALFGLFLAFCFTQKPFRSVPGEK